MNVCIFYTYKFIILSLCIILILFFHSIHILKQFILETVNSIEHTLVLWGVQEPHTKLLYLQKSEDRADLYVSYLLRFLFIDPLEHVMRDDAKQRHHIY